MTDITLYHLLLFIIAFSIISIMLKLDKLPDAIAGKMIEKLREEEKRKETERNQSKS